VNVLFATGIYPPDIGGPATSVRHLAGALSERGIGVEVVTYGDPEAGPDGDPFAVRRVARDRPLPARYGAYARAVRRAAARADLVFAQDPLSAGVPATAGARWARRPLALKVVGDLAWEIADDRGWVADGVAAFQAKRYGARVEALRAVQRRVARAAERVIVPSRYVERIVAGWGVRAQRLHVVPNGVPPLAAPLPSREAARAELGLPGSSFVIASVGRLIALKRFELLIAALGLLRGRVPDPRLVLAGAGPREDALRAHAAGQGLSDRVRLTGRLAPADVRRLLRAADVFALVSTHEGFSHVLLEAMQAGAAVVATDVGGNREVLEDGRCGRLVQDASPEGIASALVALHGAPGERARLCEAAERRARESWPAYLEGTLDVLERARARARP
jgi:glycosyltransferase involved in cell wall biosynthesis